MSFGGATSAMITSLKNNRRTRRSTFEKLKSYKKAKHIEFRFKKKASPEQLKEIRERLQKENRRNRIISITVITSLVIILFLIFNYVKF